MRRTRAPAAAVIALTAVLGGCGTAEGFKITEWDAPGQNLRIGSVLVRYAHLAEPRGEPWRPGDDVPGYLWLVNEGPETGRLLSASSPAAASVAVVDPDGRPLARGVPLPPGELRELEPGGSHLVLRDIRQVVRGGDFVEVTLRFAGHDPVTIMFQSQPPVSDPSPPPRHQGPSSARTS